MSEKLEKIIDGIVNGTRLRHCLNKDCKLYSQTHPFCSLREIYLDEKGMCKKIIKKE